MSDITDVPQVMPIAAAANLVGLSVRTLRRAIDAGQLVASDLTESGRWVIRREHLLDWVDARATQPGRPIQPSPPRPASRRGANSRRGGGLRAQLRDAA